MEIDKERKVFIIQERRKTVGWVYKSDREERKCERMINDGSDQDRRSSSHHGCHGNLSFLCTDWSTQDGGMETICQEFSHIVQEIN